MAGAARGRARTGKKAPPAKRPRQRQPAKAKPRPTTARSAYSLRDDEIERLLRSREHAAMLQEYFGEARYAELRDLAREAASTRVRGGPRVLILPGIMGSKIGRPRALLDDVLWIDPIDIARGKLLELALPDTVHRALGVVLLAYLALELRLRIAGYDAAFHPFDWRRGLDTLGAELMARAQADPAPSVHLVAHSMGGLVARAALALPGNRKISRLVMLGTPNHGSFAAVQALNATYPLLQRVVAGLDLKHSAADLARKVFSTFPGLHQMLPASESFSGIDLYDAANWPSASPGPNPTILAGVRRVQESLADADGRCFLIAGVGQETITGMHVEDGDFAFDVTDGGDGTVPLAFAELPGAKTYYVEESHGSLPNNRRVQSAVVEILADGSTDELPPSYERRGARVLRTLRRPQLTAEPYEGRRGREVTRAELRYLLDELVSPEARDRASAPGTTTPSAGPPAGGPPADEGRLDHVVVSRQRQRPIEIRLAHGSITDVRTRAYVLGLFKSVDPSGAAAAVDACLDGAVKEFTDRRMFASQVGEAFIMPTGRYRLGADLVLFTGLGAFDSFNSETLQFVAENVVRTFVRTHVDEFATVLLGAGSGSSVGLSVYNHLVGFLRGLRDSDAQNELRRITFCEIDAQRFREMRDEIYRLARTDLFDDVQVTLSEVELPPPPAPVPTATQRASVAGDSPLAYLIVRQEPSTTRTVVYRSSLLTTGSKATVLTGLREIPRTALTEQLGRLEGSGFTARTLPTFGQDLGKLVLDADVAKALGEMRDNHLVVVHDAPTSQIPWETLAIGDWFPAAEKGLSRRYAAENLSVAKWLEQRRYDQELDILLVVNPTQDLEGAEEEAKRVKKIFPASSRVRLHELRGAAASRAALLTAFRSGKYDVIHYAGHASFDTDSPSLSGINCSDARLTGADLASLSKLPALVFFNACESGRLRQATAAPRKNMAQRIATNVGLAEAFLRGGVSSYIGTYWPVGDAEAAAFAQSFYEALVGGSSVGAAVNAGRAAVRKLPKASVDWADYTHYGSQDFRVKGLGSR